MNSSALKGEVKIDYSVEGTVNSILKLRHNLTYYDHLIDMVRSKLRLIEKIGKPIGLYPIYTLLKRSLKDLLYHKMDLFIDDATLIRLSSLQKQYEEVINDIAFTNEEVKDIYDDIRLTSAKYSYFSDIDPDYKYEFLTFDNRVNEWFLKDNVIVSRKQIVKQNKA